MYKRKIWDETQGVNVDWPKSLLWRNTDQWWMDCYRCPLCWPPIQVNFFFIFQISFQFEHNFLYQISFRFGEPWHYLANHLFFFRRHFDRITVSLGDHNVKTYDDTKNVFRWVRENLLSNIFSFRRKLKRIVRSPQYDNNFINGDMALLQLEKKVFGLNQNHLPSNFLSQVKFSDTIRPACLPDDPTETYGYKVNY